MLIFNILDLFHNFVIQKYKMIFDSQIFFLAIYPSQ